ncbi:hypothetical protein HDE_12113 [Halotydeus destructor]|nr:hypothetical protein HDE_12113 [Halotydeus destructor]
MITFTSQGIDKIKKYAILVFFASSFIVFCWNSKCLCSGFFSGDRALEEIKDTVEMVYPPAVSICFPIPRILSCSQLPDNLSEHCQPGNYSSLSWNEKFRSDLRCAEAFRKECPRNKSSTADRATNSSGPSLFPTNASTFGFWDLVRNVEVLNPVNLSISVYTNDSWNLDELYIRDNQVDNCKCFSISILKNATSGEAISYDKYYLTTNVLVEPFVTINFNSRLNDMYRAYLFVHDKLTQPCGEENRLLLETNRTYMIGYEVEVREHKSAKFVNDCQNYTEKPEKFASRCHARAKCTWDLMINDTSYDEAQETCDNEYKMVDCSVTTYSPLLVELKKNGRGLQVSVQLNHERKIIRSKPRVELEELVNFESGIMGFYFGFNLIGISRLYQRYREMLTRQA